MLDPIQARLEWVYARMPTGLIKRKQKQKQRKRRKIGTAFWYGFTNVSNNTAPAGYLLITNQDFVKSCKTRYAQPSWKCGPTT